MSATFIVFSLLSSEATAVRYSSFEMSAHIQLNSREEFDKAIQEKGKYVFIYCYEGETSPQAEE